MSNKEKLVYLISLVDDDTEEVRTEVVKELRHYGTSLEEDLKEFSDIMQPSKLKLLKPILETNRREWLLQNWSSWININNENAKLEQAMSLLAQFQLGINHQPSVTILINSLAAEFRLKYPYGTEFNLSDFLFSEKNITGNQSDYFNPLNSNLIYVIQEKKGIPISLAILLILVANKLGYSIEGCNFPGHFLAKIRLEKDILLIDCYNNGKLIYEHDIRNMTHGSPDTIMRLVEMDTSSTTIIRRVINNLTNAYRNSNEFTQSDFFLEVLSKTPL